MQVNNSGKANLQNSVVEQQQQLQPLQLRVVSMLRDIGIHSLPGSCRKRHRSEIVDIN
jgi:hypothetical protein